MRDARKRIEWTAADEAVRESARIEDEALVESAYGEAYDADDRGRRPWSEAKEPTAAEHEARAAAEAARRADVAERMREAEAAVAAETPTPPEVQMATDEPVIEPQEEVRIRRALRLREQVRVLIEKLDLTDLGDMMAIVARLEMDHDLRTITAALIKELAVRQGDLSEEVPQEQMTRLFLSIGRRARVDRHDLERLVRETAGIEEEDIGRIDLLHNFAFLEVRKGVAEMVVEKMHESMFRGKEISVEPARSGGRGQTAECVTTKRGSRAWSSRDRRPSRTWRKPSRVSRRHAIATPTIRQSPAKKDTFRSANLFLETAENEREHAKVFFKLLQGGTVEITATYPAGPAGTHGGEPAGRRGRGTRGVGRPLSGFRRRGREGRLQGSRGGVPADRQGGVVSRTPVSQAACQRGGRRGLQEAGDHASGSAATAGTCTRAPKRRRHARRVRILRSTSRSGWRPTRAASPATSIG